MYGNHEDSYVIKQLKENHTIHNFNLLDEDNIYQIAGSDGNAFKLFGIGGNFLVSNKLIDKPIAGRAGKIWSTLHQFGALYKKLEKKSKPSVFVSHVSPGKEPLLTRLIIHFMPDIWISGYIGAPYTCVWNQFAIREINDSVVNGKVKCTKTLSSVRSVHLFQSALQALHDQKKHTLLSKGYIFHNPWTKRPWCSSDQVRKRAWILFQKTNVPYRNLYQTRHTFLLL